MRRLLSLSIPIALVVLIANAAFAEGGATVKIGYVDMDEDGNLAVNRETFNQYDQSLQISLERFQALMADDVRLTADLRNISVNNRNLSARISKRGLFSLSATNKQYRHRYSFDDSRFTRRRMSTVDGDLTPAKNLKLFGGFSLNERQGDQLLALSPVQDTIYSSSDYLYANFHGGLQAFCPYGSFRGVYRQGQYMDDIDPNQDRKSETFDFSLFSRIPNYRQVMVSMGYITRYDETYDTGFRIDRDQFWGAMRWNLPRATTLEYRLLSAKVEDGVTDLTTDHLVHKFSGGKKFKGYGGLRLGYQTSSAKDDVDEIESNGFTASGWFDYIDNLLVRGRIFVSSKEVKKGVTLMGDEDFTRSSAYARYRFNDLATISGSYENRVRKNDDLTSRVDYSSMSSSLDLSFDGLGDVSLSYSYYLGEFENRSDTVNFEFTDNIVRAEVRPVPIDKFEFAAGASYLRGYRDRQLEKFNADFTGKYAMGKGHYLQLRYNVATYDDLLAARDYYTANIFEITFIKDLHW